MVENGICEVEDGFYSCTIAFSDINYQTARRDEQLEIFSRYCELLNSCDPSMHLQLNIINRNIDKEAFEKNMTIPLSDQNDPYYDYQREMNGMLISKTMEGQNSITRDKYLTISTKAPSLEAAIPALARLDTTYTSHLKSIGCNVRSLSGAERVQLLFDMFHPDERFTFDYGHLVGTGLTTKDFVAPDSFNFKPEGRGKNYFEFGDKVGQCLYFQDLPSEAGDKIISDLSDLPINMNITIHITIVDQQKAREDVKKQITLMEMETTDKQDAAVSKGRNPNIAISMETRSQYENAIKILENLEEKDQRMFKCTMVVFTYADDLDALQKNAFEIMRVGSGNNLRIGKLDFQQQEAINSVIPVGKNHLTIERTLLTASTAIFIPFTTQELFQSGGMYYGLNALSRNLIFFNRKSLKAPNGFILGTPGSGKSFAAKREIINVLLTDPNSEVIIIDPEREYTPLAYGFDGEIVHISAGSKSHINPMDISMDYSDDDDPILLKSEFVLSLCELLAGGRRGLTATEYSVADRACKLIYQRYFNDMKNNSIPTLKDFHQMLKEQPEQEAKNLALSLEMYIQGSLSVFAHPTNVDTQKRFVVYDIRDLGKQLRTMGMLIVLDQIWNRITQNRALGKRTWIYIDEIQLLFNNEYSSQYFFELWSRSRKWGAIPTGITQNVETLLLSDTARRMLSNSDFIMMLNQATSDRMELANLLNISSKQLSHVTNADEGHGLLFAGKSIIPFVDKFPSDTQLYKMMTTKIDEVIRQEEANKVTA